MSFNISLTASLSDSINSYLPLVYYVNGVCPEKHFLSPQPPCAVFMYRLGNKY